MTSLPCRAICAYQLTTKLPTGFDQAEIFLTGWRVENQRWTRTLWKLSLGVKSQYYDPTTGRFVWEALADVRSTAYPDDTYVYIINFTILLTKSAGATQLIISNECSAPMGCTDFKVVPNSGPANWQEAALSIRSFSLEAPYGITSTGTLVSQLSLNMTSWQITSAGFESALHCEMPDISSMSTMMHCSAEAIGLVAAPGEIYRFPIESYSGSFTSGAFFTRSGDVRPPALPVDGAFGAWDSFKLQFLNNIQSNTWSWAAGYDDSNFCMDRIRYCFTEWAFLGDQFFSLTNQFPFELANSGSAIWTRPPSSPTPPSPP